MANSIAMGATHTPNLMPDEALVESFIDSFLKGETILLANQTLRTEPLFDSMQLLSCEEGMIATANLSETPISMTVRQENSCWQLLHQRLASAGFHPVMKGVQPNSYCYRFCEPPEQYELYCSTARELWRACWGRGFGMRPGIPLDLIVWRQGPTHNNEQWYSLRGMDCDVGLLQLKMLGWTESVSSNDLLVWAKRQAPKLGTRVHEEDRADKRAHIPFRQ